MPLSWVLGSMAFNKLVIAPREEWSRRKLMAFQRRRLDRLLQRVWNRSAYYRRHWGRAPSVDGFADLPPVSRGSMRASFNDAATDQRLRADAVQAHIEAGRGETFFKGRYAIMMTSGGSGTPSLHPYSRRSLLTQMSAGRRVFGWYDIDFETPWRTAWVVATESAHSSFSTALLLRSKMFVNQPINVMAPMREVVQALNRLQPHNINSYPNIIERLAHEQLAGRLDIHPRMLAHGGETPSQRLDELVRRAFGSIPRVNLYGATELGVTGGWCPECRRFHVFDDLVLIEAVDDRDEVVPAGTVGSQLLVTNLYNDALPLIRYRMSDRVAFYDGPNECGRPWSSLSSIDGGYPDPTRFRTVGGGSRFIHPRLWHMSLAPVKGLDRFAANVDTSCVTVKAVKSLDADTERVRVRIEDALRRAMIDKGLITMNVEVEFVDEIPLVKGKSKSVTYHPDIWNPDTQ